MVVNCPGPGRDNLNCAETAIPRLLGCPRMCHCLDLDGATRALFEIVMGASKGGVFGDLLHVPSNVAEHTLRTQRKGSR